MFPRHARHLDRCLFARDSDEAFVEEIEIVHCSEGFRGVFGGGGEVRFRVRGGEDGEVCWGILGCFEITKNGCCFGRLRV